MTTYGRRLPKRRDERIREVASDRSREMSGITGTGLTEAGRVAPLTQPGASGIAEIKGPWLKDQVTLSMEAKLILLESRTSFQLSLTDLNYTNAVTILELRNGIYVQVEPTGCYKLSWRPN